MKKYYYLLTAAICLASMVACTNDENGVETDQSSLIVNALKTRTQGSMKCNEAPATSLEVEKITFHWDNPVDIFEHFPESTTPEGKFGNYLFESNGEPFNIVMLYSNGGYRHYMGIYWYDESGFCHEQEIWNEFDDEAKGSNVWENYNGSKTNLQISRKSDKAGAYKVCLPAGTRFGFYQVSVNNNSSRTLINEKLDGKFYDYKFYTEQERNWNYESLKDKELCCQTMSMQTEVGGETWTIIGMEDISLTNYSCDKDFNDCVFALNPSPRIIVNPQTEKVEGSVETNLSVADKGSYDQVKLSLHIRANTDVSVILPIVDPVLADDFAIVAKHDIEASYSEPLTIGTHTVELIYSLTQEGYLKIDTKGICQEVLDYCNETYADGMTFECNLAYGKFNLEGTPTITFAKEPYVYVTSCVKEDAEAHDFEVMWENGNAICNDADQESRYTHTYYSIYTLDALKEMGYLKNVE